MSGVCLYGARRQLAGVTLGSLSAMGKGIPRAFRSFAFWRRVRGTRNPHGLLLYFVQAICARQQMTDTERTFDCLASAGVDSLFLGRCSEGCW